MEIREDCRNGGGGEGKRGGGEERVIEGEGVG